MIAQWLATANEWIIFAILFIAFVGAAEVGFQLAARRKSPPDEPATTQAATVQAAVLGLLALLLGFTFAMAVSRFETRVQLVTSEANAIGTAFLRTQFLPDPQKVNAIRLLRDYVDNRVEFHEASGRGDLLDEIGATTDRLQSLLWSEARTAVEKDSHAVTFGLFIASLNEMFDAANNQLAAVRNRVPFAIFAVLFFLALVAVGFTSYGPGIAEKRNLRATLIVSILIAAVVLLIVDLDRSTTGIVKISPHALLDLKAAIHSRRPRRDVQRRSEQGRHRSALDHAGRRRRQELRSG